MSTPTPAAPSAAQAPAPASAASSSMASPPASPSAGAGGRPAAGGAPPRNNRRAVAMGALIAVVVVASIAWGAWWFLVSRFYVETDDAYVQGNIVQITPQVSGTAIEVLADDTQYVEAGQPLVKLDPADARVALEQAKAQLAQTVREVRVTFASNGTLAAAITAREADVKRYAADAQRARADVERTQADLKRRADLAASGAVSGEELQHARTAVANAKAAEAASVAAGLAAKAAVDGAREQLATNQALTDGTTIENNPNVLAASAKVREAMLTVDRLTIKAPVSGYVARKSIQVGQRVAAGTPVMAVIPLNAVWVDANFKEGQLRDMRIGQPVELTADAYGSRVTYRGRVEGVSAGTGSAFAILPAQNATGNWIKIVQRVPVRVALDDNQLREHPLRVGLSMIAIVDTHDRSGRDVTDGPSTSTSGSTGAAAPKASTAVAGPAAAAGSTAAVTPKASTAPSATPMAGAATTGGVTTGGATTTEVDSIAPLNDDAQRLIDRIISDNIGSRPQGRAPSVAAARVATAAPR